MKKLQIICITYFLWLLGITPFGQGLPGSLIVPRDADQGYGRGAVDLFWSDHTWYQAYKNSLFDSLPNVPIEIDSMQFRLDEFRTARLNVVIDKFEVWVGSYKGDFQNLGFFRTLVEAGNASDLVFSQSNVHFDAVNTYDPSIFQITIPFDHPVKYLSEQGHLIFKFKVTGDSSNFGELDAASGGGESFIYFEPIPFVPEVGEGGIVTKLNFRVVPEPSSTILWGSIIFIMLLCNEPTRRIFKRIDRSF
jgi:hypothetical protein